MLYLIVAVMAGVLCGISQSRVIVDKVDKVPVGDWIELGRANPSQEIRLTVAVKRQNVQQLIDTLMDVSTPGSGSYGGFISSDEAYRMVAPSVTSQTAVRQWLGSKVDSQSEVRALTRNGDLLQITTNVGTAEEMLGCEYYEYVSKMIPGRKATRVRMGSSYTVPTAVAEHVDLVMPTLRFPVLRSYVRRTPLAVGAEVVTPSFLHSLYNTGDTVGTASNNTMAVASFQYQYYDISDVKTFWDKYGVASTTITNVPSDQSSGHGIECELDVQYISAMGQKVDLQPWYTKGSFYDALMEWAADVMAVSDGTRPLLFSVSYGTDEKNYGLSYVDRFNTDLAMLGSIGVSVFFASGDSGAGGGCVRPDFLPDYPACSPYVTAVGGTTGGSSSGSNTDEAAWLYGGGGFSDYTARQSWQDSAVEYYLNNAQGLPPSSYYNSSGRAFPDIAAQSKDFDIVVNGRTEAVSGTSCASPTAAGIFALLNDLRKANGMSELGFLNPFLYQNPSAFNDVTTGYNEGCSALSEGYPAWEKWDATSGYGTPDYDKLKGIVLKTGEQTKKYHRKRSIAGTQR